MTSAQSEPAVYAADHGGWALQERFVDGEIPVAVYGLGKMGLPLAAVFADVTGNTIGVDIDPAVVDSISRGDAPVTGEPGLDDLVAETVSDGSLAATVDGDAAATRASVHVVIVPTLLDERDEPDMANLLAAVDAVATGLAPGDLVVIESTVPPGTSRDVVRPCLAEQSGLDPSSFGVAFCPERTASGRALQDIRGSYPKVVGGVDEESERVAGLIYDEITSNEVIQAGDATTAECVKVFEGVYRDVNIALANDLAKLAEPLDVDVNRAIEVANTQPFCDIHSPGPGVGGHCIPLYPYFITSQVPTDLPVVETAREVNDEMPSHVALRVVKELRERDVDIADADVLLMGVAYRGGVDETRKAPAVPLATHLDELGADVAATDPVVDVEDVDDLPADPLADERVPADASAFDATVVVTAHDEYAGLDWSAFSESVVVDTRGIVDPSGPATTYTIGVGRE